MTQVDVNAAVWRAGSHVDDYDSRVLEPAEVVLLVRYREALAGRVLDVGCGAGRILGYLVALGSEVEGIDISEQMLTRCRERFPSAQVTLGDLSALSNTVTGPFDAVVLSDNILDVFDDTERRRVLGDVRDLLTPDGLVVFSSHNLAAWERPSASAGSSSSRVTRAVALGAHLANRSPVWMAQGAARLPRRRANRRRLAGLQYRAEDHGVFNDSAHDFALLHYYIGRDDQERQLDQLGLRLIEALEFDATAVNPGSEGHGPSLYYVATPR